MTKKQERHIVATVGTIIFLVLLFLLLWFVRLYAVVPEQEEGVEVAFGEVEEAGGYMAEENEAVPLEQPSAASPQPSAPSDNDLMTQEDEEALALRKDMPAFQLHAMVARLRNRHLQALEQRTLIGQGSSFV